MSESLTNARKYADARAVQVRVDRSPTRSSSRSSTTAAAAPIRECGTGLLGLADRVEALGGSLEVDSPPGVGTRVSARLPLATFRAGT